MHQRPFTPSADVDRRQMCSLPSQSYRQIRRRRETASERPGAIGVTPPAKRRGLAGRHIKSIERRVLATGKTKRNDIIGHTADAAHHDALADPHKLVNRLITPEESFASDARMAAQRHVFGEGHIVADIAVMPHIRPGHQTAPVADPGYTAAGRGADVHRHQFTQLAARADNELVRLAMMMHRLRWRAE